MANWKKLNKEFDTVLVTMTSEDWIAWKDRCEQKIIDFKKESELTAETAAVLIENLDEHRT